MLGNYADVRRCSYFELALPVTVFVEYHRAWVGAWARAWVLKSVGDLRARLGMGTTQTTIFQDGFTSFMGSSVDVDKFFVRFLEKMPKKHGLCFGQICQDMFGTSGY